MGDTIGCGFRPKPHTVFFTKNGRLVYGKCHVLTAQHRWLTKLHCHYSVEASVRIMSELKPCPVISVYRPPFEHPRESGMLIYANFGQIPFRFGIKDYFRYHFAYSKEILSKLPQELIQMVLEASLKSVPVYNPGGEEAQHKQCLSQVCRYWRMRPAPLYPAHPTLRR